MLEIGPNLRDALIGVAILVSIIFILYIVLRNS